MKLAMVTQNDLAYDPLAQITFYQNKLQYCQRHGYEAFYRNSGFVYEHLGFERIRWMCELLESRPDLDWIHWSGTDTLITNFNHKLEDIVDETYHIIICGDCFAINNDSFLIRNTRVGVGLLKWILSVHDTYIKHYWFEQQAMIDFYQSAPLAKDIIKVIPQRVMNSYLYDLYPTQPCVDITGNDGNWQPGDFILHLPATSLEKRIEIMTEYLRKVVK